MHTGLLGAGAFRGNRPLAIALQMMILPPEVTLKIHLIHNSEDIMLGARTIISHIAQRNNNGSYVDLGTLAEHLFEPRLPTSQNWVDLPLTIDAHPDPVT